MGLLMEFEGGGELKPPQSHQSATPSGTVLRLQIENAVCFVHSAGAAGSLYVNSFTTAQIFRGGMSACGTKLRSAFDPFRTSQRLKV